MENKFKLVSPFEPQGDQPEAIRQLVDGLGAGLESQVLLGVTGSGKTFTIANVIERVQRPALVIAHNKTLAAQLYSEFKAFFPENAVEYFVSYYDYYQPEAYLPSTGTYIEKDSSINEEIDKLRHSATRSLFERRDVIIVASVSCIYGLGSPEAYFDMKVRVEVGQHRERDELLEALVGIRYDRNNVDFSRGTFRVNGDVVEVLPIYETDSAIRIEFFGDEVDSIHRVDPLTGRKLEKLDAVNIYPGSHYVTPPELMEKALVEIHSEMETAHENFLDQEKYVEAQRIRERTLGDIEMIKAIGYCNGIENYSRVITGRPPGSPPPTLMEYFPDDALIIIDESHQTVPQVGAMLKGDRSRKDTLVGHGFRLPSAYDNRPLSFDEFESHVNQVIYVSATPASYELNKTGGVVVEQVVRPTGLVDPPVEVRPAHNQVDDLLGEIGKRTGMGHRTLVGAMTKRQAEDLTDYLQGLGVRARYLHSDIATLERMAIINELREGEFDVLIGINLLREGLDIPEVGLVAILNADMEGFLRSETSLVQTAGRAARNSQGLVILYADKMTGSMKRAIGEMDRRRERQIAYNTLHGITPTSVSKQISKALAFALGKEEEEVDEFSHLTGERIDRLISDYEAKMKAAAGELDFESAAEWRDKIKKLRRLKMI
ncbi:MAG: excinuclease ABC subunit UvrB [Nitrospinota bacterium]|nr:excinuclease ABC subunit UvrB [Nitrospinota bacterium]MDH5677196.1 excinuclease ABC subunit UvrB [Nitrospinota bacterium]